MSLQLGDKAPAFSGPNVEGKEVSSDSYLGRRNLFLVFYPKAFSPVCSVQLPTYNRNLEGFHSRNTDVVAVSVDNSFSQKAFCDSLGGIKFDVLSDMQLETAKKIGVDLPGGFTTRAEFLIDSAGIIRWLNIEASAGDDTPTMDDIFGAIDAL